MMNKFILISIFAYLVQITASAQEWVLIEQAEDVNTYIQVDKTPTSPQNETHFIAVFSEKEAKRRTKENMYNSNILPAYEDKSYCYNDAFNHFATRTYNIIGTDEKPLLESFHGFLTYDTIYGGRALYFSYWSHFLKTYGASACYYASQTQYQNENAQWVKFDEDENMERFIRVDSYSAEDSLVMYKVEYKTNTSKYFQSVYAFKEPPKARIFVYKIYENGQKVANIAESWIGKKNALTYIWLYPSAQIEDSKESKNTLYTELALLLFEQGKDAILNKSKN